MFISHDLSIKPKDFKDLVLAHCQGLSPRLPATESSLPGKSEKHGRKVCIVAGQTLGIWGKKNIKVGLERLPC